MVKYVYLQIVEFNTEIWYIRTVFYLQIRDKNLRFQYNLYINTLMKHWVVFTQSQIFKIDDLILRCK